MSRNNSNNNNNDIGRGEIRKRGENGNTTTPFRVRIIERDVRDLGGWKK